MLGLTGACAGHLYRLFGFCATNCPTHSYFLFGRDSAPRSPALIANGMSESTNLFQQRIFIGNAEIGWKVALCERDVAIYATVFVTGLFYGLVRDRLRPLPFKIYLLFRHPDCHRWLYTALWLAREQLVAAHADRRPFGFASVWLAYPYVEEAMQEVIEEEMDRKNNGKNGKWKSINLAATLTLVCTRDNLTIFHFQFSILHFSLPQFDKFLHNRIISVCLVAACPLNCAALGKSKMVRETRAHP